MKKIIILFIFLSLFSCGKSNEENSVLSEDTIDFKKIENQPNY